MARPRQFDRDEALMKAMAVFWEHGFDATTMTDLQKALGIGRQSLYTTFGDKDQLYAEALERYLELADVELAQRLGEQAGFVELRAHVLGAAERLGADEQRMGCLMMNSCVDRAPHDPAVAALAARGLESSQQGFSTALLNARDRGELGPRGDVDDIARFLTSQMAGLSVLARSGASVEQLRSVAETALESVQLMMR